MATSEDMLEQLLSLPVETRARLAQQLLESLEPHNERNRQLWADEVERRLDDKAVVGDRHAAHGLIEPRLDREAGRIRFQVRDHLRG